MPTQCQTPVKFQKTIRWADKPECVAWTTSCATARLCQRTCRHMMTWWALLRLDLFLYTIGRTHQHDDCKVPYLHIATQSEILSSTVLFPIEATIRRISGQFELTAGKMYI